MRLQTEHQQGNMLSSVTRRRYKSDNLHRSEVGPVAEYGRILLNHVCRWNLHQNYSMELSKHGRKI